MTELRAAQAGDISAIAAIDPHTPGRPAAIQALVREQASLVAVADGEIVGFLAVRPGHFYQRDFIDLLFVAPPPISGPTSHLRTSSRGHTRKARKDTATDK
jgi:hypothetical protein